MTGERIEYSSPEAAGIMGGYLAHPAGSTGKLPGVVVIHENRRLNSHIADVTLRTTLGGYPGNDDDGRVLQGKRDHDEMEQDSIAAIPWLQRHHACTGRVASIGFASASAA